MFTKLFRTAVTAVSLIALTTPVMADPPAHAPAHGWRAKHDGQRHKHKQPKHYPAPIDYDAGHCAQTEIGAVLGGVAGGVLGSTIGKGDGNIAATIGGVVVGVLLGGSIGQTMEQQDQSCAGRLLATVPDGRSAGFINKRGHETVIRPLDTFERRNRTCRSYTATAVIAGSPDTISGIACLDDRGRWIRES